MNAIGDDVVENTTREIQTALFQALEEGAASFARPFRNWRLNDVLPPEIADALRDLDLSLAPITDNEGRRETLNDYRHFFSPAIRARFEVCDSLAQCLQASETVRRFESVCGVNLSGSYLRIEYCQDRNCFWLSRHKDVPEKLLTFQVYLNRDSCGQDWGTDLYAEDGTWVEKAPSGFDQGFIFVPGKDTWHGFEKMELAGTRVSLIINYVTDAWRARHELSFPENPVL